MWLTWVVLVGMAVAMYIIIYRYEKRMEALHEQIKENRSIIEENRSIIEKNHEKIEKNHSKLKEHHNYIERMWVTIPKEKKE